MTTALARASLLMAFIGLGGLFVWHASEKPELRPGDTEALRRLQARIVEALAARESSTVRLVDYNDGNFQEVCLIRDYTVSAATRPAFRRVR